MYVPVIGIGRGAGILIAIQSTLCPTTYYRYTPRPPEQTPVDEIIGLLAGWGGYSLQLILAFIGILLVLGGNRGGSRKVWLGGIFLAIAGVLVPGRLLLYGSMLCDGHTLWDRLGPYYEYIGAIMLGTLIFILPVVLLSIAFHYYLQQIFPILGTIQHWLAPIVEEGLLLLIIVLFAISPRSAWVMCLLFLPLVIGVVNQEREILRRIQQQLKLVGRALMVVVALLLAIATDNSANWF